MAQGEKTLRVIAAMSAMRIPAHQIALTLGLSGDYVNTLRRTDLYRQLELSFLEKLEDEAYSVERDIQELSAKALNVHKGILAGTIEASSKLKLDTARDILDRAGHKSADTLNLNQKDDAWMLVLTEEEFEDQYGGNEEEARDLEEDLSITEAREESERRS